MTTASSLLSEDRFLCSICLEVFTQPVSTPCGHNFCCQCIHTYWDRSQICQCPFCEKKFSSRPELHVNTTMSEIAAAFRKMVQVDASSSDLNPEEGAAILCDICSEIKHKALKSCLVCLTSFCEAHLEPHHRVSGLKSHKLIDPVSNLDEKLCQKHSKLTDLYCRTDQAFLCVMCLRTDHSRHVVVSVEEQYKTVMVKKDEVMADIQSMIQSTSDKIGQIGNAIDVSQKEAEVEKQATVQVFDEFVQRIERNKAELLEVIEERQRATKLKAEGFLKELRTELNELNGRSSELEQLSTSEDHQYFLQNFSNLHLPSKKDWSNMGVQPDKGFEAARRSMIQVKWKADEIMKTIPEIKMRRKEELLEDLTDTGQTSLFRIQDRKEVQREREVDETLVKAQGPVFTFRQDRKEVRREREVDETLVKAQGSLSMSQDRKQVGIESEEECLNIPKKIVKNKLKKKRKVVKDTDHLYYNSSST